MKRFLTICSLLLSLALLTTAAWGQKTWTGAAGDGLWTSAGNWSGGNVPVNTDQVVLDNSNVGGSYIVSLNATSTVAINRLTITPATGNNITLLIPSTNTQATALNVGDATASTDDIIINSGGIIKNSSGATSGTPVVVNSTSNGTVRINNGGRYIHNTGRGATTGFISQLSTVAGTEGGIFEFDVPVNSSFSPSASGRTYGTLVFSNSANNAALNYTISGGSALTIKGDLILNSNATLTSSMTAALNLFGNLTFNGKTLTIPVTQALALNGTALQTIGGSSSISLACGTVTVNNVSGVSLNTSLTLSGTLTLTSANITTGSYSLTANTVNRTSGYVIGTLIKTISGLTTFDVGTVSGYTPVSITPVGSGVVSVTPVAGQDPNRLGKNVLAEYWNISAAAGITGADVVFTFLPADVTGDVSFYDLSLWNGSAWALQGAALGANTAIKTGITTLTGEWTLGTAAELPVELASFTAVGTRSGATLNWKTATEKNNYGFNVERRTVGTTAWSKIAFVKGNGTSNNAHSYSYSDANVASGSYAYRISQIDNDGATKTYSESQVTVGAAAKALSLGNYPNPFNPTTRFEFTVANDGLTVVKVYNVLGQEVATVFNGEMKAGEYQHASFNGAKFASGVYFYTIENNGQKMVKKMLMMK